MTLTRSFRFVDERLQRDLLALVRSSGVAHTVDASGALSYSSTDGPLIENELICEIRDRVFPDWGHFTLEGCETRRPQTTARYRTYMTEQGIPFVEEVIDGYVWFVVPEEHDSFAWPVPFDEEADSDVNSTR